MSFALEVEASVDEAGLQPIPRLIGPFQTRRHAEIFMEVNYPISFGSWGIAPLVYPGDIEFPIAR